MEIVDADGSTVVEYGYDAWGKNIYTKGSKAEGVGKDNPFRYRGYIFDEETEMYLLGERYYSPEIGRVISADDTETLLVSESIIDKNLYAYCMNNPVMRKDETGKFFDQFFDVVSLVASIVDVVKNPDDPWAWVGLAGDVIDLVPFVTGVGETTRFMRTADRIIDRADSALDASKTVQKTKRGWTVGDDITNLTKAGNEPKWGTVRQRYWKNEAYYNPGSYTSENLARMRQGKPPLVQYKNGKYYPMELHHIQPRAQGGTHSYGNLERLAPWEHAAKDPHRYFKP